MGRAKNTSTFRRSPDGQTTRHLMVANCGPPADNRQALAALFSPWDPAPEVTLAGLEASHCFVSLATAEAAAAAQAALQGATCPSLPGSGPLVLARAEAAAPAVPPEPPLVAVHTAAECGIPGISLHPDFVSAEEEAELLAEADAEQPWQLLAKRRVLHGGTAFDYEVRWGGAHGLPALLAAEPTTFALQHAPLPPAPPADAQRGGSAAAHPRRCTPRGCPHRGTPGHSRHRPADCQ